MEESEKLASLKKVYAQTILNTSKEAAARLMASNRRALRYQDELLVTKEEALRLLLRVKQMSDAKIHEAKTTSVGQQKRIEELEAQLHEAEDIVKELREELREVQGQLECVTTKKSHQYINKCTAGDRVNLEETLDDDRLNTVSLRHNPSVLRLGREVSSMSSNFDKVSEGSNCSCRDHTFNNYCCMHKPDFSSIVVRCKESELSRNGFMQRVRAFDRNLSGQLPLSGQDNNVEDGRHDGLREAEVSSAVFNLTVDNNCWKERKPSALKALNMDSDDVVKSFIRKRKRHARPRGRNISVPSWLKQHNQTLNMQQEADVFADVTNNDNITKESETKRRRNGEVEASNVLKTTTNCEKITDSLISDLKASNSGDRIPGASNKSNFIKFTFKRRKKETYVDNPSVCENNLKKGEKNFPLLERVNSDITCESSEDSQLVHIAEQLMYLSGKRWK